MTLKLNKISFKLLVFFNKDFFSKETQENNILNKSIRLARNLTFYLLISSVISSEIINVLSFTFTNQIEKEKTAEFIVRRYQLSSVYTYQNFQKVIMDRNIFNVNNEIPFEDTEKGNSSFLLKHFDKVPCSQHEKLPGTILGIIYIGPQEKNLVTIKETSSSMAEVYKQGDKLIDNPNIEVFKIVSSSEIEFKSGIKKICVMLDSPDNLTTDLNTKGITTSTVTISNQFVKDELGIGYAKILTTTRMIPEISSDGKVQGFRMGEIQEGSLFSKIELQNGDLVRNVNGIDLTDASQGFKLFQAFQNENNISIEIERNGVLMIKKVVVQ